MNLPLDGRSLRSRIRMIQPLFSGRCLVLILSFSFLLLNASEVMGQLGPPPGAPELVPQTPSAAKMTEYVGQRPAMYTGTANVSIPLYEINFDGWKLPLSLSYNASGLRTNEEAGEVGLGWSLNATGVISRSINGSDDLFQGIQGAYQGFVYDERPISALDYSPEQGGAPPAGSYYAHLVYSKPDTRPDVFNYNFFGFSGSFVLTPKRLGPIKAVKLSADACSIIYSESTNSFTVITPSGYRGSFTVLEKSTTFSSTSPSGTAADKWEFCCSPEFIDLTYYRQWSGRFRTVTSWYLSKIESPNGRVINFEYDLTGGASQFVSMSRAFSEMKGLTAARMCIQTVHEHVYLKKIISNEVQVDFSMEDRDDLRKNELFTGTQPAQPFPVGQKLRRFTGFHVDGLDPNSSLDKTITFKQTYFNQNYHRMDTDTEDEVRWLRSKLDRVTIDDQEYNFFYDSPGSLPDKLTTAIDHFGFYNGVEQDKREVLPPTVFGTFLTVMNRVDTVNTFEYQQRTSRVVDFNKGKLGLLNKVQYPTRGYSQFTYESHRYMPDQTLKFRERLNGTNGNTAGGARIRSIKDYDFQGNLVRSKDYFYNANPADNFSASTGKMMTPLYSRYYFFVTNSPDLVFLIYRTPDEIPGSTSAQGKLVGYSKVTEVVNGADSSYRNVYTFENRPNKYYKYLVSAAGSPSLNGQLIQTDNYDGKGYLVQRSTNSDYFHKTGEVKALAYEVRPQLEELPPSAGPDLYLFYAIPYAVEGYFVTPLKVETTVAPSGGQLQVDGNGVVLPNIGLTSVTESQYSSKTFQLKSHTTKSSTGEVIVQSITRPEDYPVTGVIGHMVDSTVNIVEPVIETTLSKGGSIVAAYGFQYGMGVDGIVKLDSAYVWNPKLGSFTSSTNGMSFASPYELAVAYKKYGANGRVLEYKTRDGILNSFLWGYGNTLPLAKGQNISNSDLEAAFAASIGTNFESAFRNHPKTIGKFVTTFQHDPLVGLVQVVSPNLNKVSYTYDQYERLKSVVDKDGNTLEQHAFHLRERAPTRILSTSSSISFGTIPRDYFQPTFLPYEKCGNAKQVIQIQNTGEDDLTISAVYPPYGFEVDWKGGTIIAGGSINLNVYFNKDYDLPNGTYSGQMVIASNLTSGISQISVSGTLVDRLCALQPSVTSLDLGQTTSTFLTKTITLQNSGNGPLKIIGTPYNWDGTSTNLGAFQSNVFTFGTSEACLFPGESRDVLVSASMAGGNGVYSGKYTLVTDVGCPPVDIPITAKRRPPSEAMVINIIPEPSTSVTFTTPSTTINLRVQNTGVYTLHVTGITANVVDPKFQISTSPFNLEPGEERVVSVSFTPDAFDFNQHDILYTFVSDKTSGDPTVALSAKRNAVRSVSLSSSLLVFSVPNAPQSVTITNTGNDKIYFDADGLTYAFAAPGGGPGTPSETSVYWDASISNVASVLDPGQTKSISIRLLPGWNDPTRQFVGLTFNKTPGVPDAYIEVKAETRILGYPSGPVTIPSSTQATFSTAIQLFNSGNSAMTLSGYSSSNGAFSVTDAFPISISANGSVNLNVTYNSSGSFNTQSTSLSLNSDATGFQSGVVSVTVQATRTEFVQMTKTDPSGGWSISFSQNNSSGYFQNTGNVPLSINSVVFDNHVSEFNLVIQYGGNSYSVSDNANPPYPALPSHLVVAPDGVVIVTMSSNVGFPSNGGGNTFRLRYSRDLSPYTQIGEFAIVISRQTH